MSGNFFGIARRHLHAISREIIKPTSPTVSRKYYYSEIATRHPVLPHVFSKEIIKPSSPTPSHLKCYNLSLMDQIMFSNYIPIVLFFPNNPNKKKINNNNNYDNPTETLQLKQSLSKALAQCYPFAGRLPTSESTYVDCNDEGIEFEEARIKSKLSEILEKQKDAVVDRELSFPLGLVESEFTYHIDKSLMVVRLTHFDCGGIALAMCLSHKVADACTFFTFLTYWAALTTSSGEGEGEGEGTDHQLQLLSPHIISHPPSNAPINMREHLSPIMNLVTRRFVFHNSKIAHLKTMVSSVVQSPTRIEVLTALLYKCAKSAAKSSSGSFSPSILLSAVNLRPKMVPSLPKTSVGNFIWQQYVETTTENGLDLISLTDQINKSKMQVGSGKVLDMVQGLTTLNKFRENNCKVYFCSSLCNYFDIYNVDFGWGKPVRVIPQGTPFHSTIIFMDTPSGDGIEALVSLDEQDMVNFERDQDLLSFASLD